MSVFEVALKVMDVVTDDSDGDAEVKVADEEAKLDALEYGVANEDRTEVTDKVSDAIKQQRAVAVVRAVAIGQASDKEVEVALKATDKGKVVAKIGSEVAKGESIGAVRGARRGHVAPESVVAILHVYETT